MNIATNIKRTTAKYKLHTDMLRAGLERLLADQAKFRMMSKSKDYRTRQEGQNGLRATTIQIMRQKQAIRNDQAENEQAYRRGYIEKFW